MATSTTTLPHILLIGSTGRTGRLLVTDALSRGHTMTALARNPSSLDDFIVTHPTSQLPQLNVIKCDPTSEPDLTDALKATFIQASSAPIVIISTLGQTRASGNPWSAPTSPPLFMTRAAEALLASIRSLPPSQKSQIRKLVIMSMFGATDSFANLHWAAKPVMKWSNMKQTVEDHDALDRVVRGQEEVEWVLVRPCYLTKGKSREVRVLGTSGEGDGRWVPSGISMESVVGFLLDCVVEGTWDRRTPVIVN